MPTPTEFLEEHYQLVRGLRITDVTVTHGLFNAYRNEPQIVRERRNHEGTFFRDIRVLVGDFREGWDVLNWYLVNGDVVRSRLAPRQPLPEEEIYDVVFD